MKVTEKNDKIQELSKKSDNEVEKIKKFYDNKVDSATIAGEERFTNSLKRSDELLIGATKNYEEKLNNFQENLLKTEISVAKEESRLKSDHAENMKNIKEQSLYNIHEQYRSTQEEQTQVQEQTQNGLKRFTDSARNDKNNIENTARHELNTLSSEYNHKGVTNESNYRSSIDANAREHQAALSTQKSELKKAIVKNTEQNKRLETEKIKVQTAELNYLDNHQKDILAQKQSDFKIRYENLVKEHDTILTQLKGHFDADVKKMTMESAVQKKAIPNKSDDSFYRVETLKPTIVENEKEYLVSLTVPEHEKENVHLTIHGRGVKMTLSRKFADTIEATDGSRDKSSRTELFSKEFPSKDILDSKQVAQNYENGVLNFRIQKL
jgi:HSP20 family molecular chaperone IbpA